MSGQPRPAPVRGKGPATAGSDNAHPARAGINAGAARSILESIFGTAPEGFDITDAADARLQRHFDNLAQMGEEHKEVRIWGGIHFRNSLNVGDAMGRKLGDYLVANYMKPTR